MGDNNAAGFAPRVFPPPRWREAKRAFAAMDCGPGTLRHRYELFEKLGQGTMGRVLRARRRADGVEFVVKQIGLAGFNETIRADILNEVCVMRQLEHPNVVAYEESFVLDDELSIVMEHLVGGDMGGAIKSRGGEPVPEEEVWDMLIQLTEGLHHLHDRRVLHRDIKLENIFVDGRGAVKIGDLGLGRLLSAQSSYARTGVAVLLAGDSCRSSNWSSGCATPLSREHSRSATFVPRTSPPSPAALTISSSHEPSWVTCVKLRWARRLVLHSGSAIWVRLGRAAAGGRPVGW